MRFFWVVFFMGCALVGGNAWAVEPGDTAPGFALKAFAGDDVVRLSALQGHWVYLDFWASWCGPCRLEFPWMNKLQDAYANAGLQVVAISLDRKGSNVRRFLQATNANFRVLWDQAAESAKRYDVKGMPMAYLIDPQGRIKAVYAGFHPDGAQWRHQQIGQLLQGGS